MLKVGFIPFKGIVPPEIVKFSWPIARWISVKDNCAACNLYASIFTWISRSSAPTNFTSLISFIGSNKNISVYAAALSGTPVSELKNINEGIILIGNESKGISEELLNIAAQKITIPRYGKAESLNAAVATGIILSGFIR